jgi:hypothetical protein
MKTPIRAKHTYLVWKSPLSFGNTFCKLVVPIITTTLLTSVSFIQ